MLFEANDPQLVAKMSTFFKRAEDEVRGITVLVDDVDVGSCVSIDTDTCVAVVFVRDRRGTPIYNKASDSFVTASIQANALTVVGDRGWRETFHKGVCSKREDDNDYE